MLNGLEDLLKEHVIKWNNYEDIVSYAILKKEWIKKPNKK
jgi:hypothetical protein